MKFDVGGVANDSDFHLVYAQAVPNHIDYTGAQWAFLPPPVPSTEEHRGRPIHRAVVFVDDVSGKGTERCGQEYVDPLLIVTGYEYRWTPFPVLQDRIENALRERYA